MTRRFKNVSQRNALPENTELLRQKRGHLGNILWFLDEVLFEICTTTFSARRPVYSHRSVTTTDESVTIRTAKSCYTRRCIVYCWNNPPEIGDVRHFINNVMRKNHHPLFEADRVVRYSYDYACIIILRKIMGLNKYSI